MRLPTGIFGLDDLIGGGFVKNTVNTILGSAGTGKTIFSIQFLLEGLERGEKSVYVSFDLDREDFEKVANYMGWNISKYIESGQLRIGKFHVENLSYLSSEVLEFILSTSERNLRIAIDSFTPLIAAIDYTSRAQVGWFFKNLREVGTSIVTLEEPFDGGLSDPSITIPLFLADSIIHIKNIGYGEQFSRTIRIVKHRFSWHAEGIYPYSIIEGVGIVIENKREEGFEDERINDLNISELAKSKLSKLVEKGVITKEDVEKVVRRLT